MLSDPRDPTLLSEVRLSSCVIINAKIVLTK